MKLFKEENEHNNIMTKSYLKLGFQPCFNHLTRKGSILIEKLLK